jgi:hypothetical protein
MKTSKGESLLSVFKGPIFEKISIFGEGQNPPVFDEKMGQKRTPFLDPSKIKGVE